CVFLPQRSSAKCKVKISHRAPWRGGIGKGQEGAIHNQLFCTSNGRVNCGGIPMSEDGRLPSETLPWKLEFRMGSPVPISCVDEHRRRGSLALTVGLQSV